MIDDQQVESLSEGHDVGVPEFVQSSLFPLDPYCRVQLESLRSSNEGRQGPAVIPGDAA
jgi:hypothetical protein